MADQIIAQSCACLNAIGLPTAMAAELSSFCSLNENLSFLTKDTEKLQATAAMVKIKIERERSQGRDCNPLVELWLRRVEEITDESLEEEYNKLTRWVCFCNCTPNINRRHKLGKRIVKQRQVVNELIEEEKQFTDYGVTQEPYQVDEIPIGETYGMDLMLKHLHKYINEIEHSIIGVWGPPGVGKTTLLSIFNNQLKGSQFNVVIFVDVSNSEALNVKAIQQTITERLGLLWVDTDTEDARAKILSKALAKKKFVILLDDVREKFQLKDIGIPLPNIDNGSKIILASQQQHVCFQMGAQQSLIKMKLLDDKASWKLFFNNLTPHARQVIESDPTIKKRAEVIKKSCGGLPLALNVISQSVAGLRNKNDWKDAVAAIKSNLSEIEGVEEIFHRMKYSYDKLDSTAKECFLYCTLFPEYSKIKKEQLVEYWIAEGFIPINASWGGSIIISKLVKACLLQEKSSAQKVRLHNVIRHFGIWLANQNNFFVVSSGMGCKSAPEIASWNRSKRISLMYNDIRDFSISPECPKLETLLLQNNPNLESLSPKFFYFMPNLKVLDLSNTGIKEFPEYCDALGQLQYLNLSHTPIKSLPKKFWILKELRYLDLSHTTALKETFNNCSKLSKLRVLNLFRSNYGICEVFDLNLDGLEELIFLGITIYAEDVLGKLKKTDPLAKSTRRLSLKHCESMSCIHVADFNQMMDVQELYIESCPNLREIEVSKHERGLFHLKVVTLGRLPSLRRIFAKSLQQNFSKLCELTVHECHKLENINWVAKLESLEKLIVTCCDGITHIIEETANGTNEASSRANDIPEEEQIQTLVEEANFPIKINGNKEINEEPGAYIEFSKLRSILLTDLEKLVSICTPRNFPSLVSIRVQGCPNLVRLPVNSENRIIKLKQICGSSEWWNKLEWEDNEIGRDLEQSFIAI